MFGKSMLKTIVSALAVAGISMDCHAITIANTPPGMQDNAKLYVSKGIYSGRQDPGWSVIKQEEVELLRSKISGLTEIEEAQECGFGYYIIYNKGISNNSSGPEKKLTEDFPDSVWACSETIVVSDSDKKIIYKDGKGLVKYLEQQAQKRAVYND